MKECINCNVDGKWMDIVLEEEEQKELRKNILEANTKRAMVVFENMSKLITDKKLLSEEELKAWKITSLAFLSQEIFRSIAANYHHSINMIAREKALDFQKKDDIDKLIALIIQNGGLQVVLNKIKEKKVTI